MYNRLELPLLPMPRIPDANIYNKQEFCRLWIYRYGGTYQNAWRTWRTDALKNYSRDLSHPFSEEELRKYGVIE